MKKFLFDYTYFSRHTIVIEAKSQDVAEVFLKRLKTDVVIHSVREATPEDPGYNDPTVAKLFEVWKDTETGQTYLEERFGTWCEASEYIDGVEKYNPGWHYRIVDVERDGNV